jgi:hypothetical protein
MNFLLLAATLAVTQVPTDTTYLYRTQFVRAAPGTLLELIDLFKERRAVHEAAGTTAPFMMRHAQGDQWDLMLLHPMGSFEDYYGGQSTARRQDSAVESGMSRAAFENRVRQLAAWQEDLYVLGPPLETVANTMNGGGYYHVEIFVALPGMADQLITQREMENDYLRRVGRPQNLIFTRVSGAAWDSYTLGVYRDLQHFAGSRDVSAERQEAAAIAAGFEGADKIGTYMRTLIQYHRDTIGPAMR